MEAVEDDLRLGLSREHHADERGALPDRDRRPALAPPDGAESTLAVGWRIGGQLNTVTSTTAFAPGPGQLPNDQGMEAVEDDLRLDLSREHHADERGALPDRDRRPALAPPDGAESTLAVGWRLVVLT
jgi:hypothetical protein